MESFLKKIFEGKAKNDSLVHAQFQKFSRGEFRDKAVILYSHSKDKFSIATTYEYANEFVRVMAEKLGNNKTNITGVLVSTRDLKAELKYKDIKQFAGVKQYILDGEMSGKEILDLLDKFPTSFFALSMKLGTATELKIKPKAPISGKPSTKASDEQKPKADFCKLVTNDYSLVRKFVFDSEINESVKKAEIKHIFNVMDIEVPRGETDPAKMREMAVRKGNIIRQIKIDSRDIKKEAVFEA